MEASQSMDSNSKSVTLSGAAEMKKENRIKYLKSVKMIKKKLSLDKDLVKSAVNALKHHTENTKNTKNLLAKEDEYLSLQVLLSQVPSSHSVRPKQIKLPHPIYKEESQSRVCIFVKDPQRGFKDLIQDMDLPCVAKVIGYQKLLKNYKQYKDRRTLLNEYDLFLCDIRIYKMLPKLIGKEFYEKKVIPYPIKFHGEGVNIEEKIKTAVDSTYFMMGNGPNYGLKIARTSMTTKQCVDNIRAAAYQIIPYILNEEVKYANVQAISLKTHDSEELPIFNQLLKSEIIAYFKKEL